MNKLLTAPKGSIGNIPEAIISVTGVIFFTIFINPEPLLVPVFTVFPATLPPDAVLPFII